MRLLDRGQKLPEATDADRDRCQAAPRRRLHRRLARLGVSSAPGSSTGRCPSLEGAARQEPVRPDDQRPSRRRLLARRAAPRGALPVADGGRLVARQGGGGDACEEARLTASTSRRRWGRRPRRRTRSRRPRRSDRGRPRRRSTSPSTCAAAAPTAITTSRRVFAFTAFGDTLQARSHHGLALGIVGPMADGRSPGPFDPLEAAVGDRATISSCRAARALAAGRGHRPAEGGAGRSTSRFPSPRGSAAGRPTQRRRCACSTASGTSTGRSTALPRSPRRWGPTCRRACSSRTIAGNGAGGCDLTPVDLDLAGNPRPAGQPARRRADRAGVRRAGMGSTAVRTRPSAEVARRRATTSTAPAVALAPVVADVLAALTRDRRGLVRAHVGIGGDVPRDCMAIAADVCDGAGRRWQTAQPGWWQRGVDPLALINSCCTAA